MAWWDSVASLTPVAAWDALHFSNGQLQDQVGSNAITVRGGVATPFPLYGLYGEEKPWPLSVPLTMPAPPYVLAAFVRHQRRGLVFCKALNSGWNYWFDQEADGVMYQAGASNYGSVGAGPAFGTPKFLALVVTASGASFYCNGTWTSTSVPLAWIGDQIGYVGYYADGNEYNISADEAFYAAGLWTGAANLSDLQALEAAVRLALAGPPVNAFYAPLGFGYSVNNPLALLPGPHPRVSQPLKASRKNIYQGGAGTIQGTVTIENIPGARKVRLFDKRTGILVDETWSSLTGHYEFNNIDPTREYFVVAHDHLRTYNAVVSDMIDPP